MANTCIMVRGCAYSSDVTNDMLIHWDGGRVMSENERIRESRKGIFVKVERGECLSGGSWVMLVRELGEWS